MAHSWIEMEDKMGRRRTAPIGFSWWALFCALFFSAFLPPLIRGNWGVAIVTLVLTLVSAGLYGLIYPFFDYLLNYNHLYRNGYRSLSYRGKMTPEEFAEIQEAE